MRALADLLAALEDIAGDGDWCPECGGWGARDAVADALEEYRIAEHYEQSRAAAA